MSTDHNGPILVTGAAGQLSRQARRPSWGAAISSRFGGNIEKSR
jgi:hypothetical protein